MKTFVKKIKLHACAIFEIFQRRPRWSCLFSIGSQKAPIGFQNFFFVLGYYEYLEYLKCFVSLPFKSIYSQCVKLLLFTWMIPTGWGELKLFSTQQINIKYCEKNSKYYFCLHCSPYILFKILNIQYIYVFNSHCMIKMSQMIHMKNSQNCFWD